MDEERCPSRWGYGGRLRCDLAAGHGRHHQSAEVPIWWSTDAEWVDDVDDETESWRTVDPIELELRQMIADSRWQE